MLRHLDTIVFMDHYRIKEISVIDRYDPISKDFVYKTWNY